MSMSIPHGTSPIMDDISARDAVSPLFATSIAFIVINTIFLVLRFYTVLFLRSKRLGLTWDDWFLIPAYVFTNATAIAGILMAHYEGDGDPAYRGHDQIHDVGRLVPVLKCIWTILLTLTAAYALTRFSILALYLRVFTSRWLRYLSYFFCVFITCQWIAYSAATIGQCRPVKFYWNKKIDGHCFNIDKFNKSFTPANIAADCIILMMPLPTILRLHTSKLRKAGYITILGMGAFALAASIVRAVVLDSNSTVVITPALTNLEVEWLVIEPSLYFITACLPTMHPLFRLFAPRPVRRAAETKIARARHNRAPTFSGATDSQPFARLTDDDSGVSRERHRAGSKTGGNTFSETFGAAGGLQDSEVEATAGGGGDRRRRKEMERGAEAVPMSDLRQVETGERIIVHTEIIVSQEERIENVMGF